MRGDLRVLIAYEFAGKRLENVDVQTVTDVATELLARTPVYTLGEVADLVESLPGHEDVAEFLRERDALQHPDWQWIYGYGAGGPLAVEDES